MDKFTLRACRINKNYSRSYVANALGVSKSTIKNWENGITEPKLNQFMQLCELYEVSPNSISLETKLANS